MKTLRFPDSGCKDMMARVVMLAMHRDGRIELPPPKWRQNGPAPITFGPDTEPPLLPPPTTLDAVRRSRCAPSCAATTGEAVERVRRPLHLGYKTLVGAQMRYAVHASDDTPLAMLGFWTLAPPYRFIGWSRRRREKNLPLVVDTPRFLILPWIRIPNLGSHILALVRRPVCRPTGPRATRRSPCSSRPSWRPLATPAPSTRPPAGSASAQPGGADATTRTTATTGPKVPQAENAPVRRHQQHTGASTKTGSRQGRTHRSATRVVAPVQ